MRSFAFFSLLFFAISATAEIKNQCSVIPPNKDLIKENFVLGISAWLRAGGGSKISNVRDFICCMPEGMRQNVTVAFASISAQESHYHSSRVIISDENNFLSFSLGNDPSLPQADNIEIMQNNRKKANGTLELYDIDLSRGSAKLSGRDPEKCLSCHGGNSENSKFGPHPIFGSDRVWGRFFGGISPFCSPGMAKAVRAANSAVEQSLDNKRLDCVDKKNLNAINQPIPLQKMDDNLKKHNASRIARIIRASPDYEKYKYLILGASFCTSGTSVKTNYKLKIAEWMPKEILKKHDDVSFLNPVVRKAASLNDAIDVSLSKEFADSDATDRYLSAIAPKIQNGENPEYREYDGVVRCQKREKFPDELKRLVKADQQEIPVYDKYLVDSHLRGTGAFNDFLSYEESHQKVNPLLRFIFEGRGLDIGDWDMSTRASSYGRDPSDMGLIFKALLDLEPEGSPAKKFAQFYNYSPPPDEVCDELKKLSYEVLSTASIAEPARPSRELRSTK